MGSEAQIIWGILFGAIGFSYFIYGRKQKKPMPLLCGIALCVFPYFTSNTYMMAGIGLLLLTLPFFIKA